MKIISKNIEIVVLLCIIFFIFFILVIGYEEKINKITKENNKLIEEIINEEIPTNDKSYNAVDGYFKVEIDVLEINSPNYIKVSSITGGSIIKIDNNITDNLNVNNSYIIVFKDINNVGNTNDLQFIIDNSEFISITGKA